MNFYFFLFNFLLFEGEFYVYVGDGIFCYLGVLNVRLDVNLFYFFFIYGSIEELSLDFEVEIIEVIGM